MKSKIEQEMENWKKHADVSNTDAWLVAAGIVFGLRIAKRIIEEAPLLPDNDYDPEYEKVWESLPGHKCPTCGTIDPYGHLPGCEWLHETNWIPHFGKK